MVAICNRFTFTGKQGFPGKMPGEKMSEVDRGSYTSPGQQNRADPVLKGKNELALRA